MKYRWLADESVPLDVLPPPPPVAAACYACFSTHTKATERERALLLGHGRAEAEQCARGSARTLSHIRRKYGEENGAARVIVRNYRDENEVALNRLVVKGSAQNATCWRQETIFHSISTFIISCRQSFSETQFTISLLALQ